jgi:hypothetical protein
VDRGRGALWDNEKCSSAGRRFWELSGGIVRFLARHREAAPEALGKADGKKRRAVYNALGVTVRPAKAKGDPIKVMFSALGGEEVCHRDRTSTR